MTDGVLMSDNTPNPSPPAGANAGQVKLAADQRRIVTDYLTVPPRRSRTSAAPVASSAGRRVRRIFGGIIVLVLIGAFLIVQAHQRAVRTEQAHADFLVRQHQELVAAHQSRLDDLAKNIATVQQSIAELEQRLALTPVTYAITGLWGNARPFAIYTAQAPNGERGYLFVPSELVVFPSTPVGQDPVDPGRLQYGSWGELIPPNGPGVFTGRDTRQAINWNAEEISPPKSHFKISERFIGPRGTIVDDVDFAYRLHANRVSAWIADRWQSQLALRKELATAKDKLVELQGQFAAEQAMPVPSAR